MKQVLILLVMLEMMETGFRLKKMIAYWRIMSYLTSSESSLDSSLEPSFLIDLVWLFKQMDWAQ